MITSRTGETLIVKSAGGNVTVVLTDHTMTKDDKGLFGLDKQRIALVQPGKWTVGVLANNVWSVAGLNRRTF
jgi:hypothetical protein